jgi:hypothetical protein
MKLKILIYTALSLVACALSAQVVTDKKNVSDKKTVWDYPVKPATEEWKNFKSNQEMVDACQIPEKVLAILSTEELTDICLHYPLIADVFAFENTNEGLAKLIDDFNGIRELYKRTDVSRSLSKRYLQKVQDFSFLEGKSSNVEKGYFIISVSVLEVFLSRIEWPDNNEKTIHKELLQNLVLGYEEKCKYLDYFKGFGLQTNFYSRSHVIAKLDKLSIELLPRKDKSSILFSGMADEQSVNIMDKLSHQLIK